MTRSERRRLRRVRLAQRDRREFQRLIRTFDPVTAAALRSYPSWLIMKFGVRRAVAGARAALAREDPPVPARMIRDLWNLARREEPS